MNTPLPGGFSLSEYRRDDREAIFANLQDRSVYEWTLLIPHPYTYAHADAWLEILRQRKERDGRVMNWAVRDPAGTAIGGIGFHPSSAGQEHAAEIGYWLAKPHWGRGTMSASIGAVCEFAFAELGLVRITAAIFAGNAGSAKVLLKNGFQLEAPLLRKAYRKDGLFIDAVLYSKVLDPDPAHEFT